MQELASKLLPSRKKRINQCKPFKTVSPPSPQHLMEGCGKGSVPHSRWPMVGRDWPAGLGQLQAMISAPSGSTARTAKKEPLETANSHWIECYCSWVPGVPAGLTTATNIDTQALNVQQRQWKEMSPFNHSNLGP